MKQQEKKDYTEKFLLFQGKIKQLLQSPPKGVQNWSYQKSVDFKKMVKKCEPAIKLQPKSSHPEMLKMEHLFNDLERYYK